MIVKDKFKDYFEAMQRINLDDLGDEVRKRVMHTAKLEEMIQEALFRARAMHAASMFVPFGVTWKKAIHLMRNRDGAAEALTFEDVRFALREHPQYLQCDQWASAKTPKLRAPLKIKLIDELKVWNPQQNVWSDEVEMWPDANGDGSPYVGVIADGTEGQGNEPEFLMKRAFHIPEGDEDPQFAAVFPVTWSQLAIASEGLEPDLITSGGSLDAASDPDSVAVYKTASRENEDITFQDLKIEISGDVISYTSESKTSEYSIVTNSTDWKLIDMSRADSKYEEKNLEIQDDFIEDQSDPFSALALPGSLIREPSTTYVPGPKTRDIRSVKPLVPQKTGRPIKSPNGKTVGRAFLPLLITDIVAGIESLYIGQNDLEDVVKNDKRTANINCVEACETAFKSWHENFDVAWVIQEKAIPQIDKPRRREKKKSRRN
jgi:hypothetical protein